MQPNFSDLLNATDKITRIVLPEGNDGRVIAAAAKASADGIAECVIIGDADAVKQIAAVAGICLPETLSIQAPVAHQYASQLKALRAHKGVDEKAALAMLASPLVFAVMMVNTGDADGMVAGAATTSADVLRPALQLIGTDKKSPFVSSAFLMCFNDGLKVFADCALLPNPTPAELATIAMQSANSARQFGITPVVAMLSYSTGDSGKGESVEKTREAVRLAEELLPSDVPVVGPIQYDAAVSPAIAAQKMLQTKTAGRATVLIFPDLASGNIAYKAVQHAANITAIGPLLQGLAKPVNDLSRGSTVDDIYHSIAATAIQSIS